MNKRIKRKVAKRIINKVGTEQSLTFFERKYFIKFFWKPLKEVVNGIVKELEIESKIQIESMKEKISELSVVEELATEQAEWFKDKSYSEETAGVVGNLVAEPATESKWQKVKGKLKGWFGK